MTTTTTETTVNEWVDSVNSGAALGEALGTSPCETLGILFPAIVNDDHVMGALATLAEPISAVFANLELAGAIPPGSGFDAAHDAFHMIQLAAGLGHMLGVAEALAMGDALPDLDSVDWGSLPDVLGLSEDTAPEDDREAGQEDS